MKNRIPTWIIPLVLGVLALAGWAGVLLVALHVSTIVLDTLDMIVQLADLT